MANETLTGQETGIENLPREAIQEILSRMTINCLFQTRYLSKSLRNLIDDPHVYAHHISQSCQTQKHPTNLILRNGKSELYCIPDLDTCEKAIKLNNLPFSFTEGFHVVGSINGLICIAELASTYGISRLCICNPVNGNYCGLPDFQTSLGEGGNVSFLMGFDSNNNYYKVIATEWFRTEKRMNVQILTIGSNNFWRSIESLEKDGICDLGYGTFVNGYLHWLVLDLDENEHGYFVVIGIKVFDVEREEFGMISVPDSIKGKKFPNVPHLGVFGGCLMMVDNSRRGFQELWVMKEYNVTESWKLEFVIPNHDGCVLSKPLGVQCNGNMLLECGTRALCSYNPRTRLHEEVRVVGLPNCYFARTAHVGTFVELKDAIPRVEL